MAFGFGFISLMFLGFATGYFFGKFVLELDEVPSLIVSLVVGICTLIVEAFLLIIKMDKMEKMDLNLARQRNPVFKQVPKVAEEKEIQVSLLEEPKKKKGKQKTD